MAQKWIASLVKAVPKFNAKDPVDSFCNVTLAARAAHMEDDANTILYLVNNTFTSRSIIPLLAILLPNLVCW